MHLVIHGALSALDLIPLVIIMSITLLLYIGNAAVDQDAQPLLIVYTAGMLFMSSIFTVALHKFKSKGRTSLKTAILTVRDDDGDHRCHHQQMNDRARVEAITENVLSRDAIRSVRNGLLNVAADYSSGCVLCVEVRDDDDDDDDVS